MKRWIHRLASRVARSTAPPTLAIPEREIMATLQWRDGRVATEKVGERTTRIRVPVPPKISAEDMALESDQLIPMNSPGFTYVEFSRSCSFLEVE